MVGANEFQTLYCYFSLAKTKRIKFKIRSEFSGKKKVWRKIKTASLLWPLLANGNSDGARESLGRASQDSGEPIPLPPAAIQHASPKKNNSKIETPRPTRGENRKQQTIPKRNKALSRSRRARGERAARRPVAEGKNPAPHCAGTLRFGPGRARIRAISTPAGSI